MDMWRRLGPEPGKLRAAISKHNRRQLALVIRRLMTAHDRIAGRNGTAVAALGTRFRRLAEIAPQYNVHPRTLQTWLERDMPDALLKRKRLTLVDLALLAEWETKRPNGD